MKIGDTLFFRESYNKHKNKPSFVSRDGLSGRIVISKKNLHRGGYFKIKSILKDEQNYALVELGERIAPNDLYPEITLQEARSVLHNYKFETFEKVITFTNRCNEQKTETQLIAWNNNKGIWVNGTTYDGEEFNNLEITAPNVLHTFSEYNSGQYITNSEEITIDVLGMNEHVCNLHETVLERLISIIDWHQENNAKITLRHKDKFGKVRYSGLHSYLYEYVKNKNTYDSWSEYQSDLFEELPPNAKEFIMQHSRK